jgi:hypothetical protein
MSFHLKVKIIAIRLCGVCLLDSCGYKFFVNHIVNSLHSSNPEGLKAAKLKISSPYISVCVCARKASPTFKSQDATFCIISIREPEEQSSVGYVAEGFHQTVTQSSDVAGERNRCVTEVVMRSVERNYHRASETGSKTTETEQTYNK